MPLSNATADNEIAFQPTVSAMLDSVFITWYQYNATLGRFRLLGRRSTNRGSSWGPIRELNTLNPGQVQGVSAPVCATIPQFEDQRPIWSRFSGTVALFEGTPVGNMVQLSSRADPLAVTMFTSGRNGTICADQSANSARYQEVNVAHWR